MPLEWEELLGEVRKFIGPVTLFLCSNNICSLCFVSLRPHLFNIPTLSLLYLFLALIGAQVSDHVFLLMTDAAVEMMFSNNGNIQLGADIGVAVGPLGRALEADIGAAPGNVAPIYTYSLSKGFYAGISFDGKVIATRNRVNERFYGRTVTGMEILQGHIPTPPAARPLYEALQRCHVYATGNIPRRQVFPRSSEMEYGELPQPIPIMPPARNDQHSYAGNDQPSFGGVSDVTWDAEGLNRW